MKKYFLFIPILCLIVSSCKSDDDGSEPQPSNFFVKAKIDNVDWEAESFTGSHINNIVSIEATANDNTKMEISVQNVTGTGNYDLGNVSIAAYEEGNGNDETYSTSGALGTGTITFTTINSSVIKGTFSFTGGNGLGNSKNITNGSFEINLTN